MRDEITRDELADKVEEFFQAFDRVPKTEKNKLVLKEIRKLSAQILGLIMLMLEIKDIQ